MTLARRIFSKLALCCLLFSANLCLGAPDTLSNSFLPPAQAFRPSVEVVNSEQVRVRFDVQPGYYLYRSKLGEIGRAHV